MSYKLKRLTGLFGIIFLTTVLALFCFPEKGGIGQKEYGVFIGMDREKVLNLKGYHRLVVDADFLTEEDINGLKLKNKEVWSYLNIGSAEAFRKIDADLQNICLGKYENWDEKWIDITDAGWKTYLLDKAAALEKKGIDGFFIDNTDIYDKDTRVEVYQSILQILTKIAKQKKPIIINGGDCFIREAMEKNDLQNIVFGVNQETVFTKIDFKNGIFLENEEQDRFYYQDYLEKCRDFGLHVFLIEYGPDEETEKQIRKYCLKKGFTLYVTSSIELDREE